MVAGNQARVPNGILKGVRTLTANIVMEMGYAEGLHREALIRTRRCIICIYPCNQPRIFYCKSAFQQRVRQEMSK